MPASGSIVASLVGNKAAADAGLVDEYDKEKDQNFIVASAERSRVREMEMAKEHQSHEDFQTRLSENNPELNTVTTEHRYTKALQDITTRLGFGVKSGSRATEQQNELAERARELTAEDSWDDFPIESEAQVARVAKEVFTRLCLFSEEQRPYRAVDISVNPYWLEYQHGLKAVHVNKHYPGFVAELRRFWISVLAIVLTVTTLMPLPETFFGSGWIMWFSEGGDFGDSKYNLAPRMWVMGCSVVITLLVRMERFKWTIDYVALGVSLMMGVAALLIALFHPCRVSPNILIHIASYNNVALCTPFYIIVIYQCVSLTCLSFFWIFYESVPQYGCPSTVVLPKAGGFTGHTHSLSTADVVANEYGLSIGMMIFNLPFVYFFCWVIKSRWLYQIREAAMYEQYGAMLDNNDQSNSQKSHTKTRLGNVKFELDEAERIKQEEFDTNSRSFLDIFRENDGFVANVCIRKYFHALPRWHREKMMILMLLVKSSDKKEFQDVAKKFLVRLVSGISEIHTGITLEQTLREQLGW